MKTLMLVSLFGLGFGVDPAPRPSPIDDPSMTIAHDKKTDGGKKKKDDEEKEEDYASRQRLSAQLTS
jgi:hypothetical protein